MTIIGLKIRRRKIKNQSSKQSEKHIVNSDKKISACSGFAGKQNKTDNTFNVQKAMSYFEGQKRRPAQNKPEEN